MELIRLRTVRLLAIGLLTVILGTSQAYALQFSQVDVEGVFNIGSSTNNLFDASSFPALVPAGYGNSIPPPPGGSGETTVTISDPLIEFGYQGATSMALFTANFSVNGMVTLTATSQPFMSNVTQTFTSPGFTGLTFAFQPGGSLGNNNSCSFASTTITCTATPGGAFTSVYQFSQVPEPASLTLLGLGLAGIIARCRKRA